VKRYLKIGGAVVLLGAAGAAGLWFWGKGEIAGEIDRQIAALEARGWTVTEGARTYGGFPLAYEVTVTDVALTRAEDGLLVRIPDLTARIAAGTADQVETRLPAEITVRVPMTEAMRIAEPALPEALTITISSEALALIAEGAAPGAREIDLFADRLSAVVAQDDYPMHVAITFDGLMARLTPGAAGPTLEASADAAALSVDWPNDIARPKIEAAWLGFDATAVAHAEDWAGVVAAYQSAAEDVVDLVYSAAGYQLTITPKASGETQSVYESADASMKLAVGDGRLVYEGIESAAVLDIRPRPPRDDPDQTNDDKAVRIGAAKISRAVAMPLPPAGEDPSAGTLTVEIDGLAPEDATWARLDPQEVLPRDPGRVRVDILTTMRVVERGVWGLPLEFSNVTVRDVTAELLGAKAEMTGDVEILQPIAVPLGQLDLTLEGPGKLLGQLQRAGLLPQSLREMGDAMLQVYAAPAEATDSYTTDITFTYEGVSVNGRRVP